MPTLHFHIGTLKTGTTFIQSVLTLNRENLLQKGYLYPISGTDKGDLHLRFCQTFLSRRLDNPLINEWIEEWKNLEREIDLDQPARVVISCESLSALDKDEVKLFKWSTGNTRV